MSEYTLMLVLPWVLPADAPLWLEAAIDAALLAILLLPVIWVLVARPLRQAARLRDYFLTDLLTTIEDERRRIAHEMHDGVGQSLTLLVSGLRSMNATLDPSEIDRRTGQLRELAQRALVDTKGLAAGLRPSLLDDLGLAAAIERVAVEVEQNHPLRVTVDVQSLSGQRLPERCETGLYRIFQEAISNVLQHSGATKASIRLTRSKTHVILDVADNGCGIEDARAGHKESAVGHLGLIGMAERATLLGGRLEIETGAGSGTNIRATIPL